jgi:hypothetical protein
MQYADGMTEAAFVLAHEHGRTIQTVGTLSLDGDGPMWQALVALNRTALLVTNEYDNYSRVVKPGHDYVMWLVEDQAGHVITHKVTDVDRHDVAVTVAEFEAITLHYAGEVTEDEQASA